MFREVRSLKGKNVIQKFKKVFSMRSNPNAPRLRAVDGAPAISLTNTAPIQWGNLPTKPKLTAIVQQPGNVTPKTIEGVNRESFDAAFERKRLAAKKRETLEGAFEDDDDLESQQLIDSDAWEDMWARKRESIDAEHWQAVAAAAEAEEQRQFREYQWDSLKEAQRDAYDAGLDFEQFQGIDAHLASSGADLVKSPEWAELWARKRGEVNADYWSAVDSQMQFEAAWNNHFEAKKNGAAS